MKHYQSNDQQRWLKAVRDGYPIKKFALKNKNDSEIKEAFNAANNALYEYRMEHLKTAIKFIKEKGRSDIATGGTHYEEFLGTLIEETKTNMIQ